tara:strand:- start:135 stop:374 length:240 start_codon:yes stop_codon:yes gene_type:complete
MTYFYEYLNQDDSKYYRFRDAAYADSIGISSGMPRAWRVWRLDEDNGAVTFVKNRLTGTMTAVDEKEFLMVQLMATPLD